MPRLVIILVVCCLFLTGGAFSSLSQSSNDVVISFDSPVVIIQCVCDGVVTPPSLKDGVVHVSTRLNDKVGDPAKYSYSYLVTGGQITGEGANVVWDFRNGFAPGEYSITVEVVEENARSKRSATRSVILAEPCCLCPCECPSVSVLTSKSQVKRNGRLTFEASVSGGPPQNVQYNWSVKNGIIETGQGTPKIDVRVSSEKDAVEVVANLEIKLEKDCGCSTSVAESVPIGDRDQP